MEPLGIVQLSLGMFASFMIIAGLVSQIHALIKSKSAKDLSWGLPLSWMACSLAWVAYSSIMIYQGLGPQDYLPPLLCNIFGIIATVITMCLKYRYDNMQRDHLHTTNDNAKEFELNRASCIESCPASDLLSSSCAQEDVFPEKAAAEPLMPSRISDEVESLAASSAQAVSVNEHALL